MYPPLSVPVAHGQEELSYAWPSVGQALIHEGRHFSERRGPPRNSAPGCFWLEEGNMFQKLAVL